MPNLLVFCLFSLLVGFCLFLLSLGFWLYIVLSNCHCTLKVHFSPELMSSWYGTWHPVMLVLVSQISNLLEGVENPSCTVLFSKFDNLQVLDIIFICTSARASLWWAQLGTSSKILRYCFYILPKMCTPEMSFLQQLISVTSWSSVPTLLSLILNLTAGFVTCMVVI